MMALWATTMPLSVFPQTTTLCTTVATMTPFATGMETEKTPTRPSRGRTTRRPWASFVASPDPRDPSQFKIDPELDKKWPAWKVPFMSLLIHYYNRFKDQIINEPQAVTDATMEYQKANDEFAEFIESSIERVNPSDGDCSLSLYDIFLEYKDYCTRWGSYCRGGVKLEALKKSVCRLYGRGYKLPGQHVWGWKSIRINS